MRIVHLLWSFTTGGTESMLVDIASLQAQAGGDVSVIVVNNMIDYQLLSRLDKHCHFFCLKRKIGSKNPLPILKLNWYLWKINPQIIHVHMDGLGKYIKWKREAILLRTVHSTLGDGCDLGQFDRIFSISNSVKNYVKRQGYDSELIYNGIDFKKIIQKDIIKIENSNFVNFKIVSVGRLEEVKGQRVLIDAIHQLKNDGVKGFSLDIIGEGNDRAILQNMIENYHLESQVKLLGLRSRDFIYNHLQEYDLFVLPSISEGFGLTLAEAMAAKVPVLTSDLDGPMEVICNGKFGYFFESGDSFQLSDILKSIVNGESLKYDVDSAYLYVMHNFDIHITAQKYLNQYRVLNS